MKHHILGDHRRDIRRVEEAADEDGVVSNIEPAEDVSCFFCRPGKAWFEKSVGKVLFIESIEDFVQIDIPALRSPDPDTTTTAAHNPCSFLDLVAQYKSPINLVIRRIDFFSVQLRQKNQRQRTVYLLRRIREDVTDSDDQAVLMKPGSVIQAGERKKLDFDFRDGSPGPKFAVRGLEDRCQIVHVLTKEDQKSGSLRFAQASAKADATCC